MSSTFKIPDLGTFKITFKKMNIAGEYDEWLEVRAHRVSLSKVTDNLESAL